jgi:PTS system nitrogen regulatory IIA component
MQVVDILTPARVAVTAARAEPVRTKREALRLLAELLCIREGSADASGALDPDLVETLLARREETLSTGVGGGVAIPHAAVETLTKIRGALLLCRDAIGFDAVDGLPCNIFFAVIGPRGEVGQHLKTLARVSRLLRDEAFRQRLVEADSGAKAFELIQREEGRPQ